jgi:hypothetical protein
MNAIGLRPAVKLMAETGRSSELSKAATNARV